MRTNLLLKHGEQLFEMLRLFRINNKHFRMLEFRQMCHLCCVLTLKKKLTPIEHSDVMRTEHMFLVTENNTEV